MEVKLDEAEGSQALGVHYEAGAYNVETVI